MRLSIRRVSNGYIVTTINQDIKSEYAVFEETNEDSVENLKNMLWHIVEEFGESGSRYDEKRIHITTQPGDKFCQAI